VKIIDLKKLKHLISRVFVCVYKQEIIIPIKNNNSKRISNIPDSKLTLNQHGNDVSHDIETMLILLIELTLNQRQTRHSSKLNENRKLLCFHNVETTR